MNTQPPAQRLTWRILTAHDGSTSPSQHRFFTSTMRACHMRRVPCIYPPVVDASLRQHQEAVSVRTVQYILAIVCSTYTFTMSNIDHLSSPAVHGIHSSPLVSWFAPTLPVFWACACAAQNPLHCVYIVCELYAEVLSIPCMACNQFRTAYRCTTHDIAAIKFSTGKIKSQPEDKYL